VGRIRYVGVLLYDAERISRTASAPHDREVYPAHLEILLDPHDPEILRAAAAQGIAPNIIEAARRSPVHALIKQWRLALPLHPEFRTLPMVWYVPPLSPIGNRVEGGTAIGDMIDRLRIPVAYLANLLTAGDEAPVRLALRRLAALRHFMRTRRVEGRDDRPVLDAVGLDTTDAEKIYRLLALAPLAERFVLPTAPIGDDGVHRRQGVCGYGRGV
jgi:nitrate reductase beta subunit